MRMVIERVNTIFGSIPADLAMLAIRFFPAMVFWQSGRTKVEGFSSKESTFFLFESEFALPLIPPHLAAVIATVAEHALPILMIVGLLTRVSALGLLVMTAVIQLFVYPSAWVTHGLWAAALLVVVSWGPGRLSLDHVLRLDRPTAGERG